MEYVNDVKKKRMDEREGERGREKDRKEQIERERVKFERRYLRVREAFRALLLWRAT